MEARGHAQLDGIERKSNSPRPPPRGMALRFIRGAFRVCSSILPGPATDVAWSLFQHPRRYREPERERKCVARARRVNQANQAGRIATYVWDADAAKSTEGASSGTVLLLHGWEGRAGQMGPLAEAFAKVGYNAVAIDAPGHGRSQSAYYPSIFQFADALRAVAEAHAPVRAVVAHSLGALATARAIRDGLVVDKIVAISATSGLEVLLSQFVGMLHLPDDVVSGLRSRAEAKFGARVWDELDALRMAPAFSVPALFVHDTDDPEMDHQQSVLLSSAWRSARLKSTSGLGHRRILRDPSVIEDAVVFVRADA